MDDIMNKDVYELIGVQAAASVSEIKKAYRKKALQCHPDKNPDNPKATELFHELSRALEILTDTSARAAYDKVLYAKQQAKLRVKELDAKRKKLKEDLEARESVYMQSLNPKYNVKTDEQKLQAEIERLRKEGSRQVEEEIAYVKNKIFEQMQGSQGQFGTAANNRIKIRWKADKNDPTNGGYDYDTLHRILSKYGDITVLLISSTKKGSALVEFQERNAAETAVQIEVGLSDNPLILKALWIIEKQPQNNRQNVNSNTSQCGLNSRLFPIDKIDQETKSCTIPSFSSAPDIFSQQNRMSDAEFESSVLSNLRRAEERKRLLEQLENEEGT